MIQKNLLKGKIVENGYSVATLAKAVGITPKTFYNKLSRGVFGSDEIYKMIDLLHITNPMEIFFATEKVAYQDTDGGPTNEEGVTPDAQAAPTD